MHEGRLKEKLRSRRTGLRQGGWGRALVEGVRGASAVEEPGRFLLTEARAAGSRGGYRLRADGDVSIVVRHGTRDVAILADIFSRHCYEPPHAVSDRLGSQPVKVLDLGANVGLFGSYVLARFSADATFVALEPDPANFEILCRCIQANGLESQWRAVRACAGTSRGTVGFAPGRFSESQITSTAGAVEVPMVDIFELVEDVSLVKIDIEGAEWPIVADPRFRSIPASAIVIEWHAHGCPWPDPEAAAVAYLEAAGYRVARCEAQPSNGTVWGWRE